MNIPKPNIKTFQPPIYHCKKTNQPLSLDGNLCKPFWDQAPFTELFVDIEGADHATPRYETRAKLLWDDDYLYIGACLEGDEIWATLTERDCVIFEDNDFEIFLNPSCDTHTYCEIELNALGTVWDLLLTRPYLNHGLPINGFDLTGMKVAVQIDGVLGDPSADNKRWMVEVAIPFSGLTPCAPTPDKKPAHGNYWRFNFSRVQWQVDVVNNQYVKRIQPETGKPYPEDNWVYAPTGIVNIHYPELWGFLFFTEQDEQFTIPEMELLRWELRKVYYNQYAYFTTHQAFCDDFEAISDGYQHSVPPKVEVTTHGFELSLLLSDGSTLSMFADGSSRVFQNG